MSMDAEMNPEAPAHAHLGFIQLHLLSISAADIAG